MLTKNLTTNKSEPVRVCGKTNIRETRGRFNREYRRIGCRLIKKQVNKQKNTIK